MISEKLFARSPRQSTDPIDDHRGRATGRGDDPVLWSESMARNAAPTPSRQSLRGLDWFIFFLADVQTGFGPFVAVYLTTQKWTQVEIGLVLSIGGLVALIRQMPGGAIADVARSERLVAGLAVATIGVSALGYAVWPIFPVVAAAAPPLVACSVQQLPRSVSVCRTACDRRTVRTQRPLRVAWQRGCRGRDGHGRLSAVEPFGVSRHLHPGNSDLACACANSRS
jgi:hypothetical protein